MMSVRVGLIGGGSITFDVNSAAVVHDFLEALRKTPDSGTVSIPDGNVGSVTVVRVQAIAHVSAWAA